jgi:hypothetical protein
MVKTACVCVCVCVCDHFQIRKEIKNIKGFGLSNSMKLLL